MKIVAAGKPMLVAVRQGLDTGEAEHERSTEGFVARLILAGVGGDPQEVVVVCDEPVLALADREGRAAIDVDADAPGVRSLIDLADRPTGIGAVA